MLCSCYNRYIMLELFMPLKLVCLMGDSKIEAATTPLEHEEPRARYLPGKKTSPTDSPDPSAPSFVEKRESNPNLATLANVS